MERIWIIPILAVLILGLIGFSFSQDSFAVGGTISNQASCEAIGGTWVPPNTCQINGVITINAEELLEVGFGIILEITNSGTINNFGTIDNFGTINNFGTITNNSGGTIQNQSFIINFGTINNFGGTIANLRTIILADNGSIIGDAGGGGNIGNFDTIVGADQVSCGTGTTLNESTNECEADTTELDACNAELMTCSFELLMCLVPQEPTNDDDDDYDDDYDYEVD